ncbi:MAG: glycoside hydrolase family 75 protein [Akkermansiaceae bacterium]
MNSSISQLLLSITVLITLTQCARLKPSILDKAEPTKEDHGSLSLLVTIDKVPVYNTPNSAVIYEHGAMTDADGSPFAYHPGPGTAKGLDYLADAGKPGDWWGIVTVNGTPVIQGSDDPAPGYYVSPTSLEDPDYHVTDTQRYVNASETPYFVLPVYRHDFGGKLGDIAAVIRADTQKVVYAIAGDGGPEDKLGEVSVKTAQLLGINDSAKDGGVDSGIIYVFFPGSGSGKILTNKEIQSLGEKHFKSFGGVPAALQLLQSKPN